MKTKIAAVVIAFLLPLGQAYADDDDSDSDSHSEGSSDSSGSWKGSGLEPLTSDNRPDSNRLLLFDLLALVSWPPLPLGSNFTRAG